VVNNHTLNAVGFYGRTCGALLQLSLHTAYLGWQTAPKEKRTGRRWWVDTSKTQPLKLDRAISRRSTGGGAAKARTYNPTLGFEAVQSAGRTCLHIDGVMWLPARQWLGHEFRFGVHAPVTEIGRR